MTTSSSSVAMEEVREVTTGSVEKSEATSPDRAGVEVNFQFIGVVGIDIVLFLIFNLGRVCK